MASCFLRALAFMDQVNTMTTKTLSMSQLLQWLNSACGPSLVEAGGEHDQRSALALVVTPECLYDPDSSRVGLALVYKPTYVKAVSFGKAYFHLRTAVEVASGKIMDPLIMFVLLSGSSAVIPWPNDHPLFLDISSPSYIEETGPLQRVQCFRGFKLHRAICLYAGKSISHVAYPRLEGGRESHYMLPQRQKITPEILESLRVTVSLARVDEGHWNIEMIQFIQLVWTSSEKGMRPHQRTLLLNSFKCLMRTKCLVPWLHHPVPLRLPQLLRLPCL